MHNNNNATSDTSTYITQPATSSLETMLLEDGINFEYAISHFTRFAVITAI